MKPLKEVAMAYMALSEAQKKQEAGISAEAAAHSRDAMAAAAAIPPEEAFDHDGFKALCHAVLAAAQVGLGHYDEALESSDIALRYFNRRGELQQDEGVQWITVVFSQAVALHETGSPEEAVKKFTMAEEMITERKREFPGKHAMEQEIRHRLVLLRDTVKPAEKQTRRAWWEFWS